MSGPDSTGQTQARKRPVRSYVIRGGRLTSGQAKALERLWPRYGIEQDAAAGLLDFESMFGRKAPVIAEIGFGNGEATWRTAKNHPEQDFIGIEVHQPGVGHLLLALEEHGLTNVRIASQDAVEFIRDSVSASSLSGVRIYFPDPWPKKRHHKRRIIQPSFVEQLAASMAPGAILHLATDWEAYAEHMAEVLTQCPHFRNRAESGKYSQRPPWRPETRYERRGKRLGHRVYDLVYERCS
jgi:tRNA (guanine-N7-)-methyltransferase